MKIEVLADPDAVAHRAAEIIAVDARAVVAARGRFVLAASGGRIPAIKCSRGAPFRNAILSVPWQLQSSMLQSSIALAPSGGIIRPKLPWVVTPQ